MASIVVLLSAESSILIARVVGLVGSLNEWGIMGVALTQVKKIKKNVFP